MDKIDRILNRWDDADLRDLAKRLKARLLRKPGRPKGARSNTGSTRASRRGASFVARERRDYCKKHGVKRVPQAFTEEALDRAKQEYPEARKSIMRELLRKSYRVFV